MELTIRDAQPADRTEWLRLWNDYLAFTMSILPMT